MRGFADLTLANGDVYSGLFHADFLYGQGHVKYAHTEFVGEFNRFIDDGDVGCDSFPSKCQNNACVCQPVHNNMWFNYIVSMDGAMRGSYNKTGRHSKWKSPTYDKGSGQWKCGRENK
jgi:hypothetical protein